MSETAGIANAGVRFPPPLVFILGLCVGWALNRYVYAWPISSGTDATIWKIADSLVVLGVLLSLWGIVTFKRARTAIIPNRSASHIVTSGPYRFTRNPMYVGMTIAYVGAALLIASAWPFIALIAVLVIILRTVILREERYLASAFGSEYTEYCGRVRRWI